MKKFGLVLSLVITGLKFYGQSSNHQLAYLSLKRILNDTSLYELVGVESKDEFEKESFFNYPVKTKTIAGYSKKQKPIELYFFPGTSNERALIIGGVHGSELSSVELAQYLISQLSNGGKPYFNVLIIPSLFPDNVDAARNALTPVTTNYGRYSDNIHADPNRQMPALGKSFDPLQPYDSYNRLIENENQILLNIIQKYKPSRIANLHAIKDISKAGIYADPRTDCKGFAMGYEKDSSLAINMAKVIDEQNGKVPGNHLDKKFTTLYHHDPQIAKAGFLQKRNLRGSQIPHNRGFGVSLGGWATTEVCEGNYKRDAIALITVEFPGYKSSNQYSGNKDREQCLVNVEAYALAVRNVFLEK